MSDDDNFFAWSVAQTVGFLTTISLFALAGVLGNSLVIVSFLTSPKLRTKTNFFLLSLAVADLLVSAVCVPLWIVFIHILTSEAFSYDKHVGIVFAVVISDPLFGVASIMNLLAISGVRLYAVVSPASFENTSKKAFALGAILFPWGISFITASCLLFAPVIEYGTILIAVLLFFLPVLILTVNYAIIIKKSMEMIKAARVEESRSSVENLRSVKMLVIVVLCFVVTWSPMFCSMLVQVHCKNCIEFTSVTLIIVKIFQFSNSMMNPIIFTCRSRDFKEAYVNILGKVIPCLRPNMVATIEEIQIGDVTTVDDIQP